MSVCSFDDCPRPVYCKGLCSNHYNRLSRQAGKTACPCGLAAHSRGLCHRCLDEDRGHGTCTCGRPVRYPKHGECHTCYTRRRYHEAKAGVPAEGQVRSDELTYEGAHSRVRRERGSARNYECFLCEDEPAVDWAYMHMNSPTEQMVTYRGMTVPISTNPADYAPLGKRCHVRLDRSAKRARTERR